MKILYITENITRTLHSRSIDLVHTYKLTYVYTSFMDKVSHTHENVHFT